MRGVTSSEEAGSHNLLPSRRLTNHRQGSRFRGPRARPLPMPRTKSGNRSGAWRDACGAPRCFRRRKVSTERLQLFVSQKCLIRPRLITVMAVTGLCDGGFREPALQPAGGDTQTDRCNHEPLPWRTKMRGDGQAKPPGRTAVQP